MSDTSDDDTEERTGGATDEETGHDAGEQSQGEGTRDRIEKEADRAKSGFDQGLVDILAWLLDTETRARIYVYLRQHPWSTSEEVAEGTGLYPSTVREALAELTEEDTVERRKRESEGAGNNPYEYTAIPPSDLVGGVVGRVQNELNTVFNLDAKLGRESGEESEPVRIQVESGSSAEAEVGGTEAEAETDVEGEVGVSEEGVDVEGEVGGEVDVEGEEESIDVEGDVEGEVGVSEEGVDVEGDVEGGVDVEGEDESASVEGEAEGDVDVDEEGVDTDAGTEIDVETPDEADESDEK